MQKQLANGTERRAQHRSWERERERQRERVCITVGLKNLWRNKKYYFINIFRMLLGTSGSTL
jgi:hypothetical protein